MLSRPDFDDAFDPLERLWDNLLSRQPEQVRGAFIPLKTEEKQAVLAHLKKMASEPGWHPEQQLSAQVALQALEGLD
jgi:hypothetical protein